MPNYCDNKLTLSHKDRDKVEKLYQAILSNSLCNAVIPLPEALRNTTSPSREPNEVLLAEFGVDNWYDFCTSRWGTKWDVIDATAKLHDDNGELTIIAGFQTAWSPPEGVYQKLIEDGFELSAMYFEGGMCFAGVISNEENSYYEDLENIPDEIKDEFGVEDDWGDEEEL